MQTNSETINDIKVNCYCVASKRTAFVHRNVSHIFFTFWERKYKKNKTIFYHIPLQKKMI